MMRMVKGECSVQEGIAAVMFQPEGGEERVDQG